MQREVLPGEHVLYRLSRRRDPDVPVAWVTHEAIAQVVRVGKKRVSIRVRFGNWSRPVWSRVVAVSPDRLRDW